MTYEEFLDGVFGGQRVVRLADGTESAVLIDGLTSLRGNQLFCYDGNERKQVFLFEAEWN